MPTPDNAPSAVIAEKILASAMPFAAVNGWTDRIFQQAIADAKCSRADAALAFPGGSDTLVPTYFDLTLDKLNKNIAALPLDEMRIRERVTQGVELWLDELSLHPEAVRKALDWTAVRPLSAHSTPSIIWSVADAIWKGIGDESSGFTFVSKRTTLSAVITSTLAVWRKHADDKQEWKAFLDRRIEDVMAFEKLKAGFKVPRFA